MIEHFYRFKYVFAFIVSCALLGHSDTWGVHSAVLFFFLESMYFTDRLIMRLFRDGKNDRTAALYGTWIIMSLYFIFCLTKGERIPLIANVVFLVGIANVFDHMIKDFFGE